MHELKFKKKFFFIQNFKQNKFTLSYFKIKNFNLLNITRITEQKCQKKDILITILQLRRQIKVLILGS
jgi:hypothetical protein